MGEMARWRSAGQAGLEGIGQQETQGLAKGLVQGGEAEAMPNRTAQIPPVGSFHPGDRSLHCQRLFSRVKGHLERGPGRQGPGELEQEPPATDIAGASVERRTLLVFSPACHGEAQGQARPGVANRPLGSKQSPEDPTLIGSNLGKCDAVRDAPRRRGQFPGPDHPRLQLDGAFIRLEADADWRLGLKAVGQLETRAPFAEVPSPTHPCLDRRARLGPMQEREVNGIAEMASRIRPTGQVAYWLLRPQFHHDPRYQGPADVVWGSPLPRCWTRTLQGMVSTGGKAIRVPGEALQPIGDLSRVERGRGPVRSFVVRVVG